MPATITTLKTLFIRNLLLIAFAAISLLSLFWFHGEYTSVMAEISSLRETFVNSQKEKLKEEVSKVINYIEYMKGQSQKRLETSIKSRTYDAYSIAENLYKEYHLILKPHELKKLIKDALRPIRFNGDRGYYFAFTLDGIEELFAVKPEIEGKNMLAVQGGNGEYVVRDMISLVKNKREGFYQYFWSKPNELSADSPKIAFVKLFEPLQWIIGTGDYLDAINDLIQDEAIRRIASLRFDKQGYFFGSESRGTPLFTNGIITKGGESIWNLTDTEGVKIVQEQHRVAAEQPDGGFVYYSWPSLTSKTPSPKLSFVKKVPDWDWIIGAGVYMDTIEKTIMERKQILKKELFQRLLTSIMILVFLFTGIYFWARYISDKIKSNVDAFTTFFRRAAEDSVLMKKEELFLEEFVDIATSANTMIEERQKLEYQLQQNHKMEAVGTLAGGIAHEFNNILGIILGNVELAKDDIESNDDVQLLLREIETATLRGRDVVSQLLIFSQKNHEFKEQFPLEPVIKDAVRFLRASLPSHIVVEEDISPGVPMIYGDRSQIYQLMINLCNNAGQAMEASGGFLRIELSTCDITTTKLLTGYQLEPGTYARLNITDTGHGISKEQVRKLFEPFYTTRDVQQGSGMGLAVVHGIIKKHNGGIQVVSQLNKGTCIECYFPVADVRESKLEVSDLAYLPKQNSTILFIDDEPALLDAACQRLERLGYLIKPYTDPILALETFKKESAKIDLVITDIIMPQMTGDRLLEELLKIKPDIKAIITTGHALKMDQETAEKMGAHAFILKPFEGTVLVSIVKKVLDNA